MDRWFLVAATVFAAIAGVAGVLAIRDGRRSRLTVVWMATAFLLQLGFLSVRGEARGACPLIGHGEILAFLAWSLTLFYLAIGPTYRLSLLGVFSAPMVVILQLVALLPGVWVDDPSRVVATDGWRETHAAMSVLGFGAVGLGAVAGVMFLVLDRQLKDHHLNSGLFRNLPPGRELTVSLQRLLWLGTAMLTVGVIAGFGMSSTGGKAHLITASIIWAGYLMVLILKHWRGLTGRQFASAAVILFVASFSVFAFI